MSTTNVQTNLLCNPDDSGVLIVDIQTQLTSAMPVKVLARLQRNAGLLLKSAALLQIPVYATEQYPQGLGNTEPAVMKMLPETTKLYEKTAFSALGAEGFLSDLQGSGRKQLVLAGMEAHVCILQTAIELVQLGYQIFVVADAVCSRQRESYETALLRLRQLGVVVCDTESILFEWVRDAKHDQFKSVQGLLRQSFSA